MSDARTPARLIAEALPGVPEIRPGDDLARLLADAAGRLPEPGLRATDVVAIAHKAVAKAEGRVVLLSDVTPGPRAATLAAEHGKDPRLVELILSESAELVRADENGIARLKATTFADNLPARAVLRRLGFVAIGIGADVVEYERRRSR